MDELTHTMECKLIKSYLGRYLAGEDVPQGVLQELEAHIAGCVSCQRMVTNRKNALKQLLEECGADSRGSSYGVAPSEEEGGAKIGDPATSKGAQLLLRYLTEKQHQLIDYEKTASYAKPVANSVVYERFQSKYLKNWRPLAIAAGSACALIAISYVIKDPTSLLGEKVLPIENEASQEVQKPLPRPTPLPSHPSETQSTESRSFGEFGDALKADKGSWQGGQTASQGSHLAGIRKPFAAHSGSEKPFTEDHDKACSGISVVPESHLASQEVTSDCQPLEYLDPMPLKEEKKSMVAEYVLGQVTKHLKVGAQPIVQSHPTPTHQFIPRHEKSREIIPVTERNMLKYPEKMPASFAATEKSKTTSTFLLASESKKKAARKQRTRRKALEKVLVIKDQGQYFNIKVYDLNGNPVK